MAAMEVKVLTVLTLNCWGIPWISKDHRQRMTSIADQLSTGPYDFVFLQEVWSKSDYHMIAERVRPNLPHSHYFDNGVLGSGLCVFSKAAIVDFLFQPFALNGYPHRIHQGDWFGGKGVGVVSVRMAGLTVRLYSVHLLAKYNPDTDDYLAHRLVQASQTSRFIQMTHHGADLYILAGDLNADPDELPYRAVLLGTGLRDSFRPDEESAGSGMTNGTPNNSYTPQEQLIRYPHGQRIDYIFYGSGKQLTVQVEDCLHPLPQRVPGRDFSFSDHEPVCTMLRIVNVASPLLDNPDKLQLQSLHTELRDVSDKALRNLTRDGHFYWLMFTAKAVLLISSVFLHFYLLQWASEHRLGLWNCLWFVVIFVLVLLSFFSIVMATVWNRNEHEALESWRLGIDCLSLMTNK